MQGHHGIDTGRVTCWHVCRKQRNRNHRHSSARDRYAAPDLQLWDQAYSKLLAPKCDRHSNRQSDKNRAQRVKEALKDAAQGAGIVMGYLEVDSAVDDGGYIISARFTTPTPAIGVELGRYLVAGLNAQEAGDEDWDAEGPLWDLQKRRRAEALPLPALQLIAEASARAIPALIRDDGQVQLGYGTRGWAFDPNVLKSPGAGLAPGG